MMIPDPLPKVAVWKCYTITISMLWWVNQPKVYHTHLFLWDFVLIQYLVYQINLIKYFHTWQKFKFIHNRPLKNLNVHKLLWFKIKKFQISFPDTGKAHVRPRTPHLCMRKRTTHVNRTYSRTYQFIYIDSHTDILYYYTQLVLHCTTVHSLVQTWPFFVNQSQKSFDLHASLWLVH